MVGRQWVNRLRYLVEWGRLVGIHLDPRDCMALGDLSRFRFAGFVITAAPELRHSDRRVPRYMTAYRLCAEQYVGGDEFNEPGRWADFRLERALRDSIPSGIRLSALQAVFDLTNQSPDYGRPNLCMTLDAVGRVLAAARIPRDKLMVLEVGMPDIFATEVLRREDSIIGTPDSGGRQHGIVDALRTGRFMSRAATPLGVEPWYLTNRLRHSWRERNSIKPVVRRAFSKLNSLGLLNDIVDFELFVPGLIPPNGGDRNARWVPLVLARHSIESVLGELPTRVQRSFKEL